MLLKSELLNLLDSFLVQLWGSTESNKFTHMNSLELKGILSKNRRIIDAISDWRVIEKKWKNIEFTVDLNKDIEIIQNFWSGIHKRIIKLSMIKLYKYIENKKLNAKMLLQVHDELIFEIRNNDVEESILTIKNIMENNHLQYKNFNVPLTIDYGVGDNWGESH